MNPKPRKTARRPETDAAGTVPPPIEAAERDTAAQEPQPTAVDAAAVVARYVELRDVRTTALEGRLLARLEEVLDSDCFIVTAPPIHTQSFDEAGNTITVTISLTVSLARGPNGDSAAESGAPMATFGVTLALEYQLTVAPPPEALRQHLFDAFASVNGLYNAWPYVREAVQSVSARMGLPPITLPVYRVPRSAKRAPQVANDAKR